MTDRERAIPIDPGPRLLSRWLNIAGVVVVGALLARDPFAAHPLWVWVLIGIALAAWLVRELAPQPGARGIFALTIMLTAVVASSIIAVPTGVLGFVPGLVCVALLIAAPGRPIWVGLVAALGSALLIAGSAIYFHGESGVVIGTLAGLVIAVLVGVSRRQYRNAAVRERELLQERLRLGEEREHAAALEERSRIARDIHDVLAHSLGGLVLQLDAVDALLESGQGDEAHSRVVAARALAASGLDEARRAVDTLRDPEASADPSGAIEDLLVTHRSLGASASLVVMGDPVALPAEAAGALRRAAQEALSNARRHAPEQPTSLGLTWGPDAVTLSASTPLAVGAPPSSPGGGRGLAGLRERMEALGGTADWAVREGAFVVTSTVPLSSQAQP